MRYSAASLAYQVGAILGGGIAPFIATLLLDTGTILSVVAYMVGICVLSLVCVLCLRETRHNSLADPEIALAQVKS